MKINMRRIIAHIMVVLLTISCVPTTNAIISGEDAVGYFYINELEPVLGNNFIVEQVEVVLNGQTIDIKRTTYSDNRVVVEITENGTTKQAVSTGDFLSLREILAYDELAYRGISTFERYAGYSYELMKTEKLTYYYSPTAMTYYDIFNDLSALLCSVRWFNLATISTIAAIICANSSADVETKIVVTEYWYLETASGAFVSYLCEYVATTYIQNSSGGWDYAGVASGDYNTLYM